jgi:hypothetical protein
MGESQGAITLPLMNNADANGAPAMRATVNERMKTIISIPYVLNEGSLGLCAQVVELTI